MMAYFKVAFPAAFDLVGTSCMNIGLLWVPASIWQMLRGSTVVFSAIMCVVFLKRKLHPHQIFHCIVVCALVMVGVVAIENSAVKDSSNPFIAQQCKASSLPVTPVPGHETDHQGSLQFSNVSLVLLLEIMHGHLLGNLLCMTCANGLGGGIPSKRSSIPAPGQANTFGWGDLNFTNDAKQLDLDK